MVNPIRGEVAIRLAGKDYAMRPTMRFIAETEAAYGSLIGLLERFGRNGWTVAELAGVIRLALAHEAGLDARTVAEAVHEAGPAHLLAPVLTLCHNALTGGRPLEARAGNADRAAPEAPAPPSAS
jgi:Phage tail tube protein, GTA-gp10